MENEKKNYSAIIVVCIALCLFCLTGGVMIGKLVFSNPVETEEKEEQIEEKEEQIEEKNQKEEVSNTENNSSAELSPEMIRFLKWTYAEKDENILENVARRKQLINMSLGPVMKETTDVAQEMGYVDYETYKKKYEEVYGDNYNFEMDYNQSSSGGPVPGSCQNHPSAGDNAVCWSINYGITGGNAEYSVTNTHQAENQYYIEGTFIVTFSDKSIKNGTFKIGYVMKDEQKYLKSINQKMD